MSAKEETVCSFQEIVLAHCGFKPRIAASLSWSYTATSVQAKHRRTSQRFRLVRSQKWSGNLTPRASMFALARKGRIQGCVRLGNPDLDFQNPNPDFPIEREIRKRISPPRNPSSGWISIKKSKSGFFGFPFYHSIGKSEKGFAKLFSWTAVFFLLIMRARARPLFLRTVFQILFRISQSNGKNENPKTDISALKSVFGFRVRLEIRNPDFENLNPDFPIERTPR